MSKFSSEMWNPYFEMDIRKIENVQRCCICEPKAELRTRQDGISDGSGGSMRPLCELQPRMITGATNCRNL